MTRPVSLLPWSLFAALIAAAGLPIYIHAPKFYVDSYGTSLAAMGGVLALLRLIDVVQDPALGWLAARTRPDRGAWVLAATVLMAVAMLGLFAVNPPVAPLLWFAITLTLLFSTFSFLTICYYAQGVEVAPRLGPNGHLQLAGWREAGSLIGICVAAVAPVALLTLTPMPFTGWAIAFAIYALVALWAMRGQWQGGGSVAVAQFRPVLQDGLARRLLLLALVNSAPVAVTSTLFLFFVESRLQLASHAGGFLLLFFLSAAASAPIWSLAARRWSAKRVLMLGMALAILSFGWAAVLGQGQATAFAAVSLVSGAALGADMVLLPAIFARRLARIGCEAAGFGLWSFVSKLSLAIAAASLLPALQAVGFRPGVENTPGALLGLSLLYAALPCGLKLVALALISFLSIDED